MQPGLSGATEPVVGLPFTVMAQLMSESHTCHVPVPRFVTLPTMVLWSVAERTGPLTITFTESSMTTAGMIVTVTVAVLPVRFAVSVALNWNVTVALDVPLSVSVASHEFGAMLTVSRGSDGLPTSEQNATGVASVSVAGNVAVVVVPALMLTVVFVVTGAASARFTNAAAGGVIACVVPGWVMNPPLA